MFFESIVFWRLLALQTDLLNVFAEPEIAKCNSLDPAIKHITDQADVHKNILKTPFMHRPQGDFTAMNRLDG